MKPICQKTLKTQKGFSMLAVILVVGVLAIGATTIAPKFMMTRDHQLQAVQKSQIQMASVLQKYVQRSHVIPDTSTWINAIASESGMPAVTIQLNTSGFARGYYVDPQFWSTTNTAFVSYNQNPAKAAAPTHPRIMIVSDLGANAPAAPVTHAEFEAIWSQSASNTFPESSRRSIERIDLIGQLKKTTLVNTHPLNNVMFTYEPGVGITLSPSASDTVWLIKGTKITMKDMTGAVSYVNMSTPTNVYAESIFTFKKVVTNASGTNVSPQTSALSDGEDPVFVLNYDVNNDGSLDIVIANKDTTNVSVLLNDGTSNFTAATGSPFTVDGSPLYMALTDLNGDGNIDIITANDDNGAGKMTWLAGDGTGAFTPFSASPWSYNDPVLSIATGDFNEDGYADVVAGVANKKFYYFEGNGAGALAEIVGINTDDDPVSLAVSDMDKDGHLDVVSLSSSGVVEPFFGDALSDFPNNTTLGTPNNVSIGTFVAVGDMNGDGYQDVISSNLDGSDNGIVSVWLADSAVPGSYNTETLYEVIPAAHNQGASNLIINDCNSDGHPDMVVTNELAGGSGDVSVLVNNAASPGLFADAVNIPAIDTLNPNGNPAYGSAFGDFGGDGILDLVTVFKAPDQNVSMVYGQDDCTFLPTPPVGSSAGPKWIWVRTK